MASEQAKVYRGSLDEKTLLNVHLWARLQREQEKGERETRNKLVSVIDGYRAAWRISEKGLRLGRRARANGKAKPRERVTEMRYLGLAPSCPGSRGLSRQTRSFGLGEAGDACESSSDPCFVIPYWF
jgi:hypothetical protein